MYLKPKFISTCHAGTFGVIQLMEKFREILEKMGDLRENDRIY